MVVFFWVYFFALFSIFHVSSCPFLLQVNSREIVAKHVKKIRMEAVKNVEKIQHHTEEHDRFYTKVIEPRSHCSLPSI